ncbi:MAG: extracellular solute-binding protein [Planctomycetes bacterium]|nr:extracellular solute-binding protein [Planctomycetota bacterium]
MSYHHCALVLPALFLFAACGAEASTDAPVGTGGESSPTIYVALDQEFSAPLLDRFASELGITVNQKHDSESSKTIGHVSRIKEERNAPRCSVFWNNEIANTAHLASEGLLEPYRSPAAEGLPLRFCDPEGRWIGFAARARILIVNTELLPDRKDWPSSYKDLTDPKWKGRCAIAMPLLGTTLTHFTALSKILGDQGLDDYITAMQENDVKFLPSNGATMREVRDGKLAFAFTDTDDYHVAKTKGFPVACVFPDQGEGEIGTMLIPNSVCLIKGGPATENGKRLIDKIVSQQTEALLAAADSAQIPLRPSVKGPADPAIKAVGAFREMDWDVQWTGDNIARCSQHFGKRFGR